MGAEHTLSTVTVGLVSESDNPSWDRHEVLPFPDTLHAALCFLVEGGSARALWTPLAQLYLKGCLLTFSGSRGPSSTAPTNLVLRPFTGTFRQSQSFLGSSTFVEASSLPICRSALCPAPSLLMQVNSVCITSSSVKNRLWSQATRVQMPSALLTG